MIQFAAEERGSTRITKEGLPVRQPFDSFCVNPRASAASRIYFTSILRLITALGRLSKELSVLVSLFWFLYWAYTW
jgi:hypothetical protein